MTAPPTDAVKVNYPEGRFYEAEFPELDEIVVVRVMRIVDMGAYVKLLEYDGKEGMMLLSELSKRRIRSVSKLLRVGRVEVCLVLRVDEEKGYIDLSKRRVAPEDATKKESAFADAKAVHGIMCHVAQTNDIDVTDLCSKIVWPLNRMKKYTSAFEAFQKHINNEINMWDEVSFSEPGVDLSHMAAKLKEDIEVDLRRKLVQQMLRLRAKVEVSCSEYEGIDAIRDSLLKGYEASQPDCEVKIQLIAHPLFAISCTCRDKVVGIDTINAAMKLVQEEIEKKGGVFSVKSAPQVDGNKDDEKRDGSGSSDGSDGSSDDRSDMGDLDDAAIADLKARTAHLDDDADDDKKD